MDYYGRYKVLPRSAADIYAHWFTPRNIEILSDRPELLYKTTYGIAQLINLATGKPYASFESTEWSPLGIYCEVVPESRWEEEHSALKSMGNEKVGLTGIFKFTMYGELPGTILEKKKFYITKPAGAPSESADDCRCP